LRWRQVVLLYVVAGVLGLWYWRFEQRAPATAPEPTRQRFVPLEASDLREVRLQRHGQRFVTRRDDDGWVVVEPEGATVPSDLIAAFANALTGAEEIARVASGGADPAQYGITADASRVEMVSATGAPVVVVLGETNPTGTALYAQRDGAHDVVLIGRQVRYYEELIFQALQAGRVPTTERGAPVGG
jgi:hypothetical protein